jgi:deoxyadenosine/deoxycytidine kinase
VVYEPVDRWQDMRITGDGGDRQVDFLKTFYTEPAKYAFSFQQFVFMTRFQQVSKKQKLISK